MSPKNILTPIKYHVATLLLPHHPCNVLALPRAMCVQFFFSLGTLVSECDGQLFSGSCCGLCSFPLAFAKLAIVQPLLMLANVYSSTCDAQSSSTFVMAKVDCTEPVPHPSAPIQGEPWANLPELCVARRVTLVRYQNMISLMARMTPKPNASHGHAAF